MDRILRILLATLLCSSALNGGQFLNRDHSLPIRRVSISCWSLQAFAEASPLFDPKHRLSMPGAVILQAPQKDAPVSSQESTYVDVPPTILKSFFQEIKGKQRTVSNLREFLSTYRAGFMKYGIGLWPDDIEVRFTEKGFVGFNLQLAVHPAHRGRFAKSDQGPGVPIFEFPYTDELSPGDQVRLLGAPVRTLPQKTTSPAPQARTLEEAPVTTASASLTEDDLLNIHVVLSLNDVQSLGRKIQRAKFSAERVLERLLSLHEKGKTPEVRRGAFTLHQILSADSESAARRLYWLADITGGELGNSDPIPLLTNLNPAWWAERYRESREGLVLKGSLPPRPIKGLPEEVESEPTLLEALDVLDRPGQPTLSAVLNEVLDPAVAQDVYDPVRVLKTKPIAPITHFREIYARLRERGPEHSTFGDLGARLMVARLRVALQSALPDQLRLDAKPQGAPAANTQEGLYRLRERKKAYGLPLSAEGRTFYTRMIGDVRLIELETYNASLKGYESAVVQTDWGVKYRIYADFDPLQVSRGSAIVEREEIAGILDSQGLRVRTITLKKTERPLSLTILERRLQRWLEWKTTGQALEETPRLEGTVLALPEPQKKTRGQLRYLWNAEKGSLTVTDVVLTTPWTLSILLFETLWGHPESTTLTLRVPINASTDLLGWVRSLRNVKAASILREETEGTMETGYRVFQGTIHWELLRESLQLVKALGTHKPLSPRVNSRYA